MAKEILYQYKCKVNYPVKVGGKRIWPGMTITSNKELTFNPKEVMKAEILK